MLPINKTRGCISADVLGGTVQYVRFVTPGLGLRTCSRGGLFLLCECTAGSHGMQFGRGLQMINLDV